MLDRRVLLWRVPSIRLSCRRAARRSCLLYFTCAWLNGLQLTRAAVRQDGVRPSIARHPWRVINARLRAAAPASASHQQQRRNVDVQTGSGKVSFAADDYSYSV